MCTNIVILRLYEVFHKFIHTRFNEKLAKAKLTARTAIFLS